jgi:homoserine kinase
MQRVGRGAPALRSLRSDGATGQEIIVPASISNLGPGFDTLGVAVSLYLRVRVAAVIADGRGRLECRFANGPLGGPNRIEEAFRNFPSSRTRARTPSLVVDVKSEIPLRSGLGSSAAAAIAGLRLGELVNGRRSADDILRLASEIEGHPDNAAPALFGGFTSCCVANDGSIAVTQWPWPAKWRIVVATPDAELRTSVSRRVLPRRLPLPDAVFNLQHLALLLGSLGTGNVEGFREALGDRMHQPYRERLVPGLRRLLSVRHPDVIGFCLSGAGPSIAAFTPGRTTAAERMLRDAYRKERIACTVRTVRVHRKGHA